MKSHLCNRCGSCVGLSDGSVRFKDKTGSYGPEIVGKIDDELAGKLWYACSGQYFDFPEFRKKIFPDSPSFHIYTGSYQNIYIGFSKDEEIRQNAASDGIISSILIYLLEKKEIDGAVTLRMSPKEPWMNEPFIATNKNEILDAAQSKYTINSVNEILAEVKNFQGKLAYIGLPGQVQSIRKLQSINDPSVRNIKYIFGPFYGNTLHFSSIISFLKSYGINDYHDIKKLYFRYGEWPGNMRIELKNGQIIELKKFHANYLIPFHILKNSLFCTDLSNEFTDISVDDAWSSVYEERGNGFSLVISRSLNGQKILDKMKKDGRIDLMPFQINKAIEMHSHGYDLKKRGAFIIIKFRKWTNKIVPDYGYTIKGFSLKRYLMEILISFMFLILGTKIARWSVEQLSPKFIGKVFENARTKWKKSTRKIKRQNLN